ncbi:hypothetical protein [Streptomyces sp. NBC_00728]|uniref:hypothetical protein n=1 Tax=Streptomyces sp. NBC_00728 TaxID=2903676 RepID=UPI003867AC30
MDQVIEYAEDLADAGLLHTHPVRVLGVDDFVLRKGDTYATLLVVDLEARRPLDVLAGRDPPSRWPHRCAAKIARAGTYAEGAACSASTRPSAAPVP